MLKVLNGIVVVHVLSSYPSNQLRLTHFTRSRRIRNLIKSNDDDDEKKKRGEKKLKWTMQLGSAAKTQNEKHSGVEDRNIAILYVKSTAKNTPNCQLSLTNKYPRFCFKFKATFRRIHTARSSRFHCKPSTFIQSSRDIFFFLFNSTFSPLNSIECRSRRY